MTNNNGQLSNEQWLKRYYFIRALFSIVWVAAAFTLGRQSPTIGATLLIIYPAWDALANYIDAVRSGGLAVNRAQKINVIVSIIATLGVAFALRSGMNSVLAVFGVWASFSGLLQLITAVRRWKDYGAQWTMILSGGQSALVGLLFIHQARMPDIPSISNVTGYAALGAFYFLVSAIWLTVGQLRRKVHSS